MANFTTAGSSVFPAGHVLTAQYSGLKADVGLSTSDRTNLGSHTFTITGGNRCLVLAHAMVYRSVASVTDYCHLFLNATDGTEVKMGHVVQYRMPTSDTYWDFSARVATGTISGTSCVCFHRIDVVNGSPGYGLESIDYHCLEIEV